MWMAVCVRNMNKLVFPPSLTNKALRISEAGEMPATVNFIRSHHFLHLFRGCWPLKGGEENQLLQLMADVIKPIYLGGVRNGTEGERAMGRATWPHHCFPK